MFNQLFGKHYQQPRPHRNRTRTCARQLSQQKPHCWNCPPLWQVQPSQNEERSRAIDPTFKMLGQFWYPDQSLLVLNALSQTASALGWQMFLSLRPWVVAQRFAIGPSHRGKLSTALSVPRNLRLKREMQYRDRRGNNSQSNLLVAV